MKLLVVLKRILTHPLNKDQKLTALWRFVKWQLLSRSFQPQKIFPFISESQIILDRSFSASTACLYTGLYEFEEMAFLLHVLKKSDLFIDVGANVGIYTLLASKVNKAESISFEPSKETFNRLVEHIELNNIKDRVKLINRAIGDAHQLVYITKGKGQQNHIQFSPSEDAEKTNLVTLDDTIALDKAALLKIDTEGFEERVLQGASILLKNPLLKSIILERGQWSDRYKANESDILRILDSHGFKAYSYDPFDRILAKSEYSSIFIRDFPWCANRVSSSPKVKIQSYNL